MFIQLKICPSRLWCRIFSHHIVSCRATHGITGEVLSLRTAYALTVPKQRSVFSYQLVSDPPQIYFEGSQPSDTQKPHFPEMWSTSLWNFPGTQWRTCLQPRIAPITFSIYETSPQVIPGILLSTILAITGGALDHPGDHEGELLGPFPFVAAGRWRCHRVRHRLSQLLGLHGAGEDDKFYWENTDIRVMKEMVASCVQQDKREAEGSRSLQLCLGTSLQVG